jgi:hypothetical protein
MTLAAFGTEKFGFTPSPRRLRALFSASTYELADVLNARTFKK